jgi:hypothetical protein
VGARRSVSRRATNCCSRQATSCPVALGLRTRVRREC